MYIRCRIKLHRETCCDMKKIIDLRENYHWCDAAVRSLRRLFLTMTYAKLQDLCF